MQKGLVSVIIPTYNRAHAVGRAIESVLSQDYSNIEVLVIDDGSKDDTSAKLAAYKDNPRVRLLPQANQGAAAARNYGMREARGEFIAFLDSDDYFLPGKLKLQIECLEALPEAGIIWSDMDAIDLQGKVVSRRFLRTMYGTYRFFPKSLDLFQKEFTTPSGVKYYFGDIFSPIVLGNLVHTSTLVMRAERQKKIGFYDPVKYPRGKPGEDHHFHMRLCQAGPVAFVDAVTIHYMIGAADAISGPAHVLPISLSHLEILTETLAAQRSVLHLPKSLIRTSLADAYGWAGQAHFNAGLMPQARGFLVKSLAYQPWRLERWKYLIASLVPKTLIDALKRLRH